MKEIMYAKEMFKARYYEIVYSFNSLTFIIRYRFIYNVELH